MIPLASISAKTLGKRISKVTTEAQEKSGYLTTYLVELFKNHKLIKIFQKENLEINRADEYLSQLKDKNKKIQTINDLNSVIKIIKNTVGNKGYIALDSIFHPYNLVNGKGVTAWDLAWFRVYAQDNGKFIQEIGSNKTATVIKADTLNLNDNFRIWPNDSLNPDTHKQYSKYVPFVFPYLIYKNEDEPHWSAMIKAEMELQGHAQTYIENFNSVFSEFVDGHVMTLGFGEFDRENLDDLVLKFTDFYEKNIKN